ncbi:MAG: hypothetical protein PVF15_02840 [Candidatus Bathyarchaeota archaeon]
MAETISNGECQTEIQEIAFYSASTTQKFLLNFRNSGILSQRVCALKR